MKNPSDFHYFCEKCQLQETSERIQFYFVFLCFQFFFYVYALLHRKSDLKFFSFFCIFFFVSFFDWNVTSLINWCSRTTITSELYIFLFFSVVVVVVIFVGSRWRRLRRRRETEAENANASVAVAPPHFVSQRYTVCVCVCVFVCICVRKNACN